MFAVKKQNPLSFRGCSAISNISEDEIFCDFQITETMIYDAITNTVREKDELELLSDAKIKKIDELKIACKAQIESGFLSNALGTDHTYDSAPPQDQTNLLGAKIAGVDMNFTCTDNAGVKWERPHTAAQIAQVYVDGMVHIQTAKARFYARVTSVQAATTPLEIEMVVW